MRGLQVAPPLLNAGRPPHGFAGCQTPIDTSALVILPAALATPAAFGRGVPTKVNLRRALVLFLFFYETTPLVLFLKSAT